VSARCTGEPVSWLRLEGFHLGEIQGGERASIEAHLAACAACTACLAYIEDDDARALPSLSLPEPARRGVLSLLATRGAAAVGALAAAAALVVAIRASERPRGFAHAPVRGGAVKGDAIAFSLVRDDDERIAGASGVYRDGDRFKAVVTCPPGASVVFDIVVYDASGASFPLDPAGELACGNEVAVPGAFRLTGDADETVCLVWSEGALAPRDELARRGAEDASRLCKRLSAAPKP
jgi:hypothetical protein